MSETVQDSAAEAREQSGHFRDVFTKLKTQVHKAFVGQDEIVENVLSVLLSLFQVRLEAYRRRAGVLDKELRLVGARDIGRGFDQPSVDQRLLALLRDGLTDAVQSPVFLALVLNLLLQAVAFLAQAGQEECLLDGSLYLLCRRRSAYHRPHAERKRARVKLPRARIQERNDRHGDMALPERL